MPDGLILPCPECGQKNRIPRVKLADEARCGRCKGVVRAAGGVAAVDHFDDLQLALQSAEAPVLIDFWAPWCGPCRMVAPEVAKVASRRAADLVVLKVNTDIDPAVGNHYRIQSIPTMALFDGGRERARTSGARPANAIEDWVRASTAAR